MMAVTLRKIIKAGTRFDRKWQEALVWQGHQNDWAVATIFCGCLMASFAFTVGFWTFLLSVPFLACTYTMYRMCKRNVKRALRAADHAHHYRIKVIERAIAHEDRMYEELLRARSKVCDGTPEDGANIGQ